MKSSDAIASVVIGLVAGLLMYAIGRNLPDLPNAIRAVLWVVPFVFPLVTLTAMAAGSFVGRRFAVAYQFSKFVLVGGQNFLIDLGVLNLLIAATAVTGGAAVVGFKVASFLVAVTASFLWNKFWTFRSLSIEHAGFQFIEFLIISAVALGINAGVFALVNNAVGPQAGISPPAWASISGAAAAVVGLLWNFVGYKFVVFRR